MKVSIQKNHKRYKLTGRLSHRATFGGALAQPATLNRQVQYVKDQGTTNYCTAAARATAGSYLFGRDMSFEYQTAKEGEIAGNPIFDGADPQLADKASENYGFCPEELCTRKFVTEGYEAPARWQLHPSSEDAAAIQFLPGEPYNVYPDFEHIKNALVQGHGDNAVVIANAFWFAEWQDSASVLPTPKTKPITRHDYLFIDFKTVGGQEFLVAQLSQGADFGDGGCFLMNEECVNIAFKNPAFNGIGCEMFRKTNATPIQTKITLMQRLVMLLGVFLHQLQFSV